jgi:hypothetical protein
MHASGPRNRAPHPCLSSIGEVLESIACDTIHPADHTTSLPRRRVGRWRIRKRASAQPASRHGCDNGGDGLAPWIAVLAAHF